MIIALFALAVAMIVGGLLAAFLGWDIVLVERGWTMVIAGSVFAASGALLLGIAAAVSKLSRIQGELARLHADLNDDEAGASLPTAQPSLAPAAAGGLSLAALSGGLFGSRSAEAAPEPEPRTEQPPLPLFPEAPESNLDRDRDFEPGPAADSRDEAPADLFQPMEPRVYPEAPREPERVAEEEEAPEVRVPDFLIADRYREAVYTEIEDPETDETLYAPGPDEARSEEEEQPSAAPEEEEERREARGFDETEEPVTETAPEEDAAADEETRADAGDSASTIVGTYNSGDNRYVMFSDGSIEAQTPQGVFRFNSLDELKEFIASGGEGDRGSSAT
ncbi:hypothetical protein [Microvirga lenta]|uniref:hypothetical protein n=1 Tax=Microvirga lenta TaxID=2881337 RepID=UPI001CFF72BA|nr:hypothetical protein [Microvirga lenta]MCB5176330.1 hypothetical protein [Microvirga lenta]